jgi:alpha-amylase
MKHLNFVVISVYALLLILSFAYQTKAQNDVMMQAFYWNVPVDDAHNNGFWWDSLSAKAAGLKSAGYSAVWTPPPSKGAWGVTDMGYGIFDHYDLGEYSQAGNHTGAAASIETRFGSKSELLNMVTAFHNQGVQVYSDIVLNHVYGGVYETNPAVKYYVQQQTYPSYPTSTLRWVIPNAAAGDYYIQVQGFNLNWSNISDCGYELLIRWTNSPDIDTSDPGAGTSPVWESEPNNGSGQNNTFPGNGSAIYGHSNYSGDIDEFKVTLSSASTIIMQLQPKYDNSGTMNWNSDDHGYRISAVWYNGSNIYPLVQLRTFTNFTYATHDAGIPQWTWNYQSFHPVDTADYLQDMGYQDAVRPNWMLFGPDFNTYDAGTVEPRLKTWGQWLTNTVGYDGYRLDFVRGFQESFTADWLSSMPLKSGAQRFAVGEYWTTEKYRLHDWVNTVSSDGAKCSVFDFPLRDDLKRMCNAEPGFNMSWLNHSGMIRDLSTPVPADDVVTFLENHDTGKEPDKWITQDAHLGYAFILFAQGRPCIFYPNYYGVKEVSDADTSVTTGPETGLKGKLDTLIAVRNRYLSGGMTVLTEVGSPYPASDTVNLFIARREGDHNSYSGGILAINNGTSGTMGAWVTTNVSGYPTLTNQVVYNRTTGSGIGDTVQGDSRVYISAPQRGYAEYTIDSTYLPVNFTVNNAYTSMGQNVYLVGNIQQLGNWNTSKALGPFNASSYPTWNMNDIYLPRNSSVQYKYILKDGSGNVTWESGNNHTRTTPSSGHGSFTDNWGMGKEAAKEQPKSSLPTVFALSQNYPNPFNPSTTITYDVPQGKNVNVKIVVYNSLGQPVRTLVDERKFAGSYSVVWDGNSDSGTAASSGIYFYKIKAGSFEQTKKMTFLK